MLNLTKLRRQESAMELVKVKRHYQITIPQNLRKLIQLAVGDYVEIDVHEGALIIRPVKVVYPDQEYFFTPEWQEKEAAADRDIAERRLSGPVSNIQEALTILEKEEI